MNLTINIPTIGRAGNMETIKILPSATYWVHEFEIDKYRAAHSGIKAKPIPDKLRGNVARVRNFILKENARADFCLMVDDDVSHIAYWENNIRVKLNGEREIVDMVERYSILAREFGVKLWRINVNNDKQVYREYTPFSLTSYVSASFACFLNGNDIYFDERFSLKEDYDMTIQQANKYRGVLRVNKFYYMKRGADKVGGCSFYRNVKKEVDQIKLLQKKWGTVIVKFDPNYRNHLTTKTKTFDINPVVTIPIRGV